MIPKRLGFALLALVPLFALGAGLAGGATTTVSGTGVITGSGTSYTLRITNTGTEAIKCWRLTLPAGVMAAAIGQPPAGWQLGAPGPPPQPVFGGQSATGVPPGGSADFPFTTDKGFPAGLASALRISGDCKTDTDAAVTGPSSGGSTPPPPTPTPKPKPCECKKLTVEGRNYSSAQANSGSTSLKLTLRWFLGCSSGAGNCVGKLKLSPPAGSDLEIVTPKATTVTCQGKCDAGGPTSASGSVALKVTSDETLDFDKRRGQTVVFSIRRFCVRNGKDTFVGSTKLRLVFGSAGFLDKKKSDLNGNNKPDGDEKK